MAAKKKAPRAKGKDARAKPRKKRVSPIVKEGITYVDYKDVTLLRAFLSDRAKIRAQRVSGNNRQQQREAANAIKIAREMALLPYAQRVVTQRKGDKRRGRPDRDRPDRPDRPPRDADGVEGAEGAEGVNTPGDQQDEAVAAAPEGAAV